VLGTEMARHKDVVKAAVARCVRGPVLAAAPSTSAAPVQQQQPPWSADDRRALMAAAVHAADVSAPSRPPGLAGMWARAVCEEFFQQSEREANRGLVLAAPSPNRKDSVIWKSQARCCHTSQAQRHLIAAFVCGHGQLRYHLCCAQSHAPVRWPVRSVNICPAACR
jgi:3'5'-cyclic nucleotide phosphodiesterase